MLGSAFQGTGGLPPFVTAQLVFPYQRGLEFVQRLVQVGGGRWTLVDAAHRSHPPVSTEQILHPDKYLRFEEPERVRLDPGAVLGGGWRRAAAGVMGEWETGSCWPRAAAARPTRRPAGAAIATSSGSARSRPAARPGCGPPCPGRDALVIRWRWDTPEDRARVRGRAAALGRAGPGRAGGRSGRLVARAAGRWPWRAPATR